MKILLWMIKCNWQCCHEYELTIWKCNVIKEVAFTRGQKTSKEIANRVFCKNIVPLQIKTWQNMTGFVYHDYLCQPLTEKLILFNLRQSQAMNDNHRHNILMEIWNCLFNKMFMKNKTLRSELNKKDRRGSCLDFHWI